MRGSRGWTADLASWIETTKRAVKLPVIEEGKQFVLDRRHYDGIVQASELNVRGDTGGNIVDIQRRICSGRFGEEIGCDDL